jgi:hypothetical protein
VVTSPFRICHKRTVAITHDNATVAHATNDPLAISSLARAWASHSGDEKDLLLAAGNAVFELSLTFSVGGMLFLFGAAPVLYGAAMLQSTEHRGWIAWIGLLFGLVGLAAAGIQVMSGASWLAFYVLFPIAAIGITLWMIYLGFRMWSMASSATR